MLDTYLSLDAALSAIHGHYSVCLSAFWNLVGVIFGGLVIWLGLLFARYIQVHSMPRRRGRR